jgi:hypothetical protein
MSLIKDSGLATWTTSGNKTVYTLNNLNRSGLPTKLGDFFNYLPSGIVIKSETGMGATTLEIKSPRNSIIVEPLKVTAFTKHQEHGGLYVGTKPGPTGGKAPTKEEIQDYLKGPDHKKIVCVVDSLKNVMDAIPLKDRSAFFLLLDETDSLQLDSGFRPSMSVAIDLYKNHPKNMRATVTATPLEFSDPDLQKEPITEIKYETPNIQEVTIVQTHNYLDGLELLIEEHFTYFPSSKLVVALNSVDAIEIIRQNVELTGILRGPGNIKILCSKKKKSQVGRYFHELEAKNFPGLLNFKTAAYFTGFDIDEQYHLIVVCNPMIPSMAISEHRFKQIAGRARNGLLSAKILYQWKDGFGHSPNSLEELIEAAERLIKTITCLNHQYQSCPVLGKKMENTIKGILENSRNADRKLVFEDSKTNEFKISYLNIDSIQEFNRLHEDVFKEPDGLQIALEMNGFIVTDEIDSTSPVATSISTGSEWFALSQKNLNTYLEQYILDTRKHPLPIGKNDFESEVLNLFKDNEPYFKSGYIKDRITNATKNLNGWRRSLSTLKYEFQFAGHDPSSNLENVLTREFQIGKSYTETELNVKWEHVKTSDGHAYAHLKSDSIYFLNRIFLIRMKDGKHRIKSRAIPEISIKKRREIPSPFKFDTSEYLETS